MTLLDLATNGSNITVQELADLLIAEMEVVIDDEYAKEGIGPEKGTKTQAEQCAIGRHGKIVESRSGEMCEDCGLVNSYYLT